MNKYTRQPVYLGIDVHKRTYSVTAVSEGAIVKVSRINACPSQLVDYCRKFFPDTEVRSCYEAGFSGFFLHRELIAAGIKNSVIHPASIEIESNSRVKSDKRDSRKMAVQLSQNRLKGIYVPSPEREDFRTVSRLRRTLIKERVRTGLRIKSLLYLQGAIRCDDNVRISKKWLAKLPLARFSPGVAYTLQTYIETWLNLTQKIDATNDKLKEQAMQERELEDIYTSLPGIGPIAARLLINELGDLSQFSNEERLFSFVGLTPTEHSSGEHRWLGHITRQGRPVLRAVLVQCAWVAIKHDYSLKTVYDKLQCRIGSRKAIVAIARKLIGRAKSCLKANRKYEIVTASGELVTQKFTDVQEVVNACEEAVHSCS